MNNTEICHAIQACIGKLTTIVPDIRFRENFSSIMVSWQDKIPDESTSLRIEDALKQFGNPVPTHCRESNFVCFLIIR